MKILNYFFIFIFKIYKLIISPHIGNNCRFIPTCSEYAMQSFKKHKFLKAFYLTIKRLSSCHPKGKSGFDPVP